jgi:hypothetical protein
MAAVLRSIFAAASTQKGEASREFLLALVQGRLVVSQADTRALHGEFGQQNGDPVSQRMWQDIASKYLS